MEEREQELYIPQENLSAHEELKKPLPEFDTSCVIFPEKVSKNSKKVIIFITTLLAAVGINCGVLTGTVQETVSIDGAEDIQKETMISQEKAVSEEERPFLFYNENGKCHIVIYNEPPYADKTNATSILMDTTIEESRLADFQLPKPDIAEAYDEYAFVGWCLVCSDGGFVYMIEDDSLDTDNILRIPVHDGVRYIELHAVWTLELEK